MLTLSIEDVKHYLWLGSHMSLGGDILMALLIVYRASAYTSYRYRQILPEL